MRLAVECAVGADGFYRRSLETDKARPEAMPSSSAIESIRARSVRGVGLIAATIAVAMAARGPLSRSTPVDAASAGAPATALFMLLVGRRVRGARGDRDRSSGPGAGAKQKTSPSPSTSLPEAHWIWKLLAFLLPLTPRRGHGRSRVAGRRAQSPPAAFGDRTVCGTRGASSEIGAAEWVCIAWLVAVDLRWRSSRGDCSRGSIARESATPEGPEPPQRIASRARPSRPRSTALGARQDPREAVIAAYSPCRRRSPRTASRAAASEAPREYLRRVLAANRATGREAGP